jgi:hypothetical protein
MANEQRKVDIGDLEARLRQLEATFRQVFPVSMEAFSQGDCTNDCTARCTIECTNGCTGVCVTPGEQLGAVKKEGEGG